MLAPSYADTFEVLCLQAADKGRGPVLFGDSFARARQEVRPFVVGQKFPNVYLEFPLTGDPFLDVTLLYDEVDPDTHIASPAVEGTCADAMLAWCSDKKKEYPSICCGFELDTKQAELPRAAIHFQPRAHTELVGPFCELIGEPERAQLYLDTAARMPKGWPLSFFGMFRGRPGSPLRVCGYLDPQAQKRCAESPDALQSVFDELGFTAYNEAMLNQIAHLMAIAPATVDFQFDVNPDGTFGSTFAIDMRFGIQQPHLVKESYVSGPASRVMGQLEAWGAADERWQLGGDTAFARSIPVECDDGSIGRFSFTLMPQWAKARWTETVLQPSKLYLLGNAGFLEDKETNGGKPAPHGGMPYTRLNGTYNLRRGHEGRH